MLQRERDKSINWSYEETKITTVWRVSLRKGSIGSQLEFVIKFTRKDEHQLMKQGEFWTLIIT